MRWPWTWVLLGMTLLAIGPSCDKIGPSCGKIGPSRNKKSPPPAAEEEPAVRHRVFPSAGAALAEILASDPRVIGFGEFHQTNATSHVPSALQRFTNEMLDVLASSTSDIIVETWVQNGACGAQEQQVATDVRQATERPDATGDEVQVLAERARDHGIQPHALTLDCADYEQLLGDDGAVDYEALLGLITRELRATTARVLSLRDQEQAQAGKGRETGKGRKTGKDGEDGMDGVAPRRRIVVYGGSLHNDLHPYEGLASYSYAADVQRQTGGGFVEVDLYVPEIVEGNPLLSKEPWYPLLARLAAPDRVILVERGPASFIIILPRSS